MLGKVILQQCSSTLFPSQLGSYHRPVMMAPPPPSTGERTFFINLWNIRDRLLIFILLTTNSLYLNLTSPSWSKTQVLSSQTENLPLFHSIDSILNFQPKDIVVQIYSMTLLVPFYFYFEIFCIFHLVTQASSHFTNKFICCLLIHYRY